MEIQMTNHTQLLNYIATKIGAKSYLEIGTQSCKNFNSIQVPHKVGVDPDLNSPCAIHKTSDEFFRNNSETFSIVFIDGLHHSDQVKRDIENAWNCLSEKGVIVVHDCNPSEEKYTHVPRDSKVWNGSVYKAICQLRGHLTTPFTIDFDHGCCVIRKEGLISFDESRSPEIWEAFNIQRTEYLNLVSLEEGLKIIDAWT